jgi:hypothetical protein
LSISSASIWLIIFSFDLDVDSFGGKAESLLIADAVLCFLMLVLDLGDRFDEEVALPEAFSLLVISFLAISNSNAPRPPVFTKPAAVKAASVSLMNLPTLAAQFFDFLGAIFKFS